jgi:hypothetical protein
MFDVKRLASIALISTNHLSSGDREARPLIAPQLLKLGRDSPAKKLVLPFKPFQRKSAADFALV